MKLNPAKYDPSTQTRPFKLVFQKNLPNQITKGHHVAASVVVAAALVVLVSAHPAW